MSVIHVVAAEARIVPKASDPGVHYEASTYSETGKEVLGMDMTKMLIYGAIFVAVVIVIRFVLNRPSQLKVEHEQRMKELKEKSKDKYRETRQLPKDKKKY